VLQYLGIEQFRTTPLVQQPFEHLIVPQFIGPQPLAEINADYPRHAQTARDIAVEYFDAVKLLDEVAVAAGI